ncbi:hypothetical protein GQ457_18G020700 [Hibiscus cannabinus]
MQNPMTAYSQQFGVVSEPNQWVHEVSTVSLENKIDQLTNIIYSLIAGRNEPSRVCGICTMPDHPTDYCPILQGETSEMVYAVGTFPTPPQMPYNTYSNAYNPRWRDHSNFSYAQNSWPNPTYQPYQPLKSSLESLVERLEQSQERLTQSMSRLESCGKLETNPQENVSAMTLSSGMVIEQQSQENHDTKISTSAIEASDANSEEEGDATTQKRNSTPRPIQSPHIVQPLFPPRLIKEDKHAEEKEVMDVFGKVKINIPLLEVIQKMPRYARFLEELCANTRNFMGKRR